MSSNNARHLVDSFETQVSRLARYQPGNLVFELDAARIDRLVKSLPDRIAFMQQVLYAAQQKQRERRMAHRA